MIEDVAYRVVAGNVVPDYSTIAEFRVRHEATLAELFTGVLAGQRALQGSNAQAAVNERQIVIAAEVTVDSPAFGHLDPMVDATEGELNSAGAGSPDVVVADAGYWHKRQMENVVDRGIQVLIPPDSGLRKSARPGWDGGPYACMRQGALPTTPSDRRAGIRADEVQPTLRSLPTPRRIGGKVRMAVVQCEPQPAEAPQPSDGGRGDLKAGGADRPRANQHAARRAQPIACPSAPFSRQRPWRPAATSEA